jgi:hypothetical protein
VGLSWALPFSWEFVEIVRLLPSAPVAVMAREVALAVCQVNVTVWPEAMLLLLTDNVTVGADFPEELPELEPPPQPVNDINGKIAANPSNIYK